MKTTGLQLHLRAIYMHSHFIWRADIQTLLTMAAHDCFKAVMRLHAAWPSRCELGRYVVIMLRSVRVFQEGERNQITLRQHRASLSYSRFVFARSGGRLSLAAATSCALVQQRRAPQRHYPQGTM
jgi:hypothetical protein